jgi:hypothetical protein
MKHIIACERPFKEDPVLWILHNHESYFSILAINVAQENGIFLLTLLHHTSRKLQPLDCTVFGPYTPSYNACINDWMMSNPGKRNHLQCCRHNWKIFQQAIYQTKHLKGV